MGIRMYELDEKKKIDRDEFLIVDTEDENAEAKRISLALVMDTVKNDSCQEIMDNIDKNLSGLNQELSNKAAKYIEDLRFYYGDENVVPTPEEYFSYRDNGDGTCTITGLSELGIQANLTNIVFPYEISELKVVKIENGSVNYDSCVWGNTTTYIIPTSVTEIGGNAFLHTPAENIYIPDSVTKLGFQAFGYPANLKRVRLSENLKTIDGWAFYDAHLDELYIPDSVETIDDTNGGMCFAAAAKKVSLPFHSMINHTSPQVAQDGAVITIRGGEEFSEATVPCIGESKNIRVILPNTCKRICNSMIFWKCENPIIEIPSSVTEILTNLSVGIFSECTNPLIICEQGSYADTWAKENGINVKYDIVGNFYSIEQADAKFQEKLTEGQLAVLEGAVADLRYYYGTENITPTPGSCFTYTDNGDGTCTITGWTDEFTSVVDCVIPYQIDGLLVTGIDFAAFGDGNFHGGIQSVIMPNSITYLGGRAFAGCYILSKVKLSEGLRYIGSYDGSGVINENFNPSFVFENTAILELEIPKSVIAVDTSIVYKAGDNPNYCFSKLIVHSPETALVTATGWLGIKILCHKGSLAEHAITSMDAADQVVYFDFDPNDVPIPEYVSKAGAADTAEKATTADTASVAGRLLPTITYYGNASKVGFFKIAEVASGSRGFTAIISATNLSRSYNFRHSAVVNFSFGSVVDEDLSKITQIAGDDITHKICYVRNTETNAWSVYYYREKGEPVNITFVNVYKDAWIGQGILFASAEDYTVLDTALDTTNAVFATYYPAEREGAFSNALKGTYTWDGTKPISVSLSDISPIPHKVAITITNADDSAVTDYTGLYAISMKSDLVTVAEMAPFDENGVAYLSSINLEIVGVAADIGSVWDSPYKNTVEYNRDINKIPDKQDKLSEEQIQNINDVQNKVAKEQGKGLSSNDYTTEEKQAVAKIFDKADVSYVKNTFANALKGTASGAAVGMHDVSPLEHTMGVKVRSKNIAYNIKYENGSKAFALLVEATVVPMEVGKIYTVSWDTEVSDVRCWMTLYSATDTDGNPLYRQIIETSPNYQACDGTRKFVTFKLIAQPKGLGGTVIQQSNNVVSESPPISNFMVEEGDVATEYTPYVPDVTAVSLKKYRKNILDIATPVRLVNCKTSVENNQLSIERSSSIGNQNVYYSLGEFTSFVGKTVTLSIKNDSAYNWTISLVGLTDAASNYGLISLPTGSGIAAESGKQTTLTYTIPETENAQFFGVRMMSNANAGNVGDIADFSNCQVEMDAATNYEPYKEPTTYVPNADGTVEGVTSLYPVTTLLTDTEGVVIDCEYNRDINEALSNLNNELTKKSNKSTTLAGYGITNAYTKTQIDTIVEDTKSMFEYKTNIINRMDTAEHTYAFDECDNEDYRLFGETTSSISIHIPDGEYPEDYISGLSFSSGETPTAIDYTGTGILNWVGTDCSVSEGYSIFQPSPNTHYDIVFYFNGAQFVGLVNGYVPAVGNKATGNEAV